MPTHSQVKQPFFISCGLRLSWLFSIEKLKIASYQNIDLPIYTYNTKGVLCWFSSREWSIQKYKYQWSKGQIGISGTLSQSKTWRVSQAKIQTFSKCVFFAKRGKVTYSWLSLHRNQPVHALMHMCCQQLCTSYCFMWELLQCITLIHLHWPSQVTNVQSSDSPSIDHHSKQTDKEKSKQRTGLQFHCIKEKMQSTHVVLDTASTT